MALVFIALIGAATFLIYQFSPARLFDRGADTVSGLADKAANMFNRAFGPEQISVTFTEELTRIADSNGGQLEVAVIESTETISRKSKSKLRGTTVSRVRAPSVFKFTVPLRGEWKIEVKEAKDKSRLCRVTAPVPEPSLPVAFHTNKLEQESQEGWLRWDSEEEMNALMTQITPLLNRRAEGKVDLARDKARVTIEEFIRTWLLDNDQWSSDTFSSVEIRFADEVPAEEMPAPTSPAALN